MKHRLHFLGEEFATLDYSQAKFIFFPFPYEKTTSYLKGTAEGPRRILEASEQVEAFDPETKSQPYKAGIYTFEMLNCLDVSPEQCLKKNQIPMQEAFTKGKFVVTLGGEHTVSLAPVHAAAHCLGGQNFSVLHLDAHSDMRNSYEGTPFSHACVMRRIHEFVEHTYSIGIRALCEEEHYYIKKHTDRFGVQFDHERAEEGLNPEKALSFLPTQKVYITIDIDFFSPELVPAVGTPVPGGGNWYDTLRFLKTIFLCRDIIGIDVVELKPEENRRSDFLAAQLIHKLIAYQYQSLMNP